MQLQHKIEKLKKEISCQAFNFNLHKKNHTFHFSLWVVKVEDIMYMFKIDFQITVKVIATNINTQ